jgi:CheY-like chemotaxis protein
MSEREGGTAGASGSGAGASSLAGLRVLVVEDEALVVMLLEDLLADIGCEIAAVATRLAEAQDKARSVAFDVAILDVNLHGQQTFPLARTLLAEGRSVVFATGYGAGSLPAEFQSAPILQKPFQQPDLERVLRVAGSSAGGA